MSANVIRGHLRNGEWDLARRGAEAALETAEPSDQGVLYALLARAWYRLGKPRRALEAAEQGAERSDHWEVSLALGESLVATGDPLAARVLLTEALKSVREHGADRPTEIGVDATADDEATWQHAEVLLRIALAEAWRAAGDAETALEVAERAAKLGEVRYGAEALETAEALLTLGRCLHAAGHDEAARKVLDRALGIWRADDPEHTGIAAALDALGIVDRALRKPFRAVERHREALALWTRRLGEHAAPTGASRYALAQALHRTGDFRAALAEMEQAFAITSRALGADHLDTWITAFELGRFEMDNGRTLEGLSRMDEARDVVASRLGADHPVVVAMDRHL